MIARRNTQLALFIALLPLAHAVQAEYWEGWYEQRGQRVNFSAELNSNSEAWLSGRTSELESGTGGRSVRLSGELSGERRGEIWRWQKRYVGVRRDTIDYVGVLSPDGSEIVGWWNIRNLAHGSFRMRR